MLGTRRRRLAIRSPPVLRAAIERTVLRAIAALALAACAFPQAHAQPNTVLALNKDWQFRQIYSEKGGQGPWLPATVPGDVHLDLLANGKIDDPFFGENEAKLQWIEKARWEYRTCIYVTAAQLARTHLDLVFEGLDAAALVYVNGAHILTADNMFREWRVAVKNRLHAGNNELRIVFPPPLQAAKDAATADPSRRELQTEDKAYIRKAAYEYGWDWGPRFVTSGIWRPVKLEEWDNVRIDDFALRQRDVSAAVAHVDAEIEVQATTATTAIVSVEYADKAKLVTLSRTVKLHAGSNILDLPAEVVHPKLWYPAGYGEQALYSFKASIKTGGHIAETRTVRSGLRTLVLRREPDQWGRSFELIVNGIPVFAKGANVIPFDSFPNRVTPGQYRHILQSARDANMNMLRQWGGGYYESEEFYRICDELGIMVWQDFMFANEIQPASYAFRQNIEAEADHQVRRLRNHPSIVIWCGNNETELALNWGLPPERADSYLVWQDYVSEFNGILPRVLARLDPEAPYWASSPSAEYESQSDQYQSGDAHIWDVWHGHRPFDSYETHHARFVTEFGFQSFPEMRTLQTFTQAEDRTDLFTPVMLAHQKNKEGNQIIREYLQNNFPAPKDFASFLYLSQVLQAEGVKIGAEHFRRERPRTMGSLFWQLNDCWPVTSWSSIDYFGRWKALQYYSRRFYAPVLVSPHIEDRELKVYIVSDGQNFEKRQLRVRLMDFFGNVILQETRAVDIPPLSSQIYLKWPLQKMLDAGAADMSRVMVVAEAGDAGDNFAHSTGAQISADFGSRNVVYLRPSKELHLPPAKLNLTVEKMNTKPLSPLTRRSASAAPIAYKITLVSPQLARSVYISFGDLDVDLSDNYFDLLPGDNMGVLATTAAPIDELRRHLTAVSLVDALAPAGADMD